MARRSRTANPASHLASLGALGAADLPGQTGQAEAGAAEAADSPAKAAMRQLLSQFEAVLRDNPAIDQNAREALQQEFSQVLSGAVASPEPPVLPDKNAWREAVQALQDNGAVAEDDANQLIRQFDHALQPLQRRESQLAIEFSRRMQTEGQEKALAWFKQQTSAAADSSASTQVPSSPSRDATPLRSETIHSRSRHLRGPPRQR